MKDLLKVVLVLGVTLGSLGCLTTSRTYESPKEETYTLVVQNQNWDAKTVRVFCNAQQVKTLRGLSTGETREVSLPVCHGQVRLGIEYLGAEPWVSDPFTVGSGQAVKLDIAAFRNYNTFWIA